MKYIIKKIGYGCLVMLGLIILVFIIFQGLGDPSKMIVGQSGDAKTIANIQKDLYLDQPKWKQLLWYVNDVSPISIHADSTIKQKNLKGIFIGSTNKVGIKYPYLRSSYQTKKEVSKMITESLPGTIMLAITAMLFATFFGILLGIIAALNKDSWIDKTSIFTSIIGISAPSFFMAILIAYLFGFLWQKYTGLSLTGSWFDVDEITGKKIITIKNIILPAITLGIRPLAIITQLTRSCMIEVMQQDYIRTAFAKGLNKKSIVWKHALRNALNPVITAITGWFAELLAGAFFVEYIFGWKGIGKLTVDALEKLDYPVFTGAILVSGLIFVIVNILSDIAYKWIDPRIK